MYVLRKCSFPFVASQHFYLFPVQSSLAKNRFYQVVFRSFASLLLIAPIIAIMVLGCLLSSAVCRANKWRRSVAPSTTLAESLAHVSLWYYSAVSTRESRITIWYMLSRLTSISYQFSISHDWQSHPQLSATHAALRTSTTCQRAKKSSEHLKLFYCNIFLRRISMKSGFQALLNFAFFFSGNSFSFAFSTSVVDSAGMFKREMFFACF